MDEKQMNGTDFHRDLAERETQPSGNQDHFKWHKERWLGTEGGKLCMAFYEAFQAYKGYLEKNMLADPQARDMHNNYYDEHALFAMGLEMVNQYKYKQEESKRRSLEKAKKAARCHHVHANGEQCGSPKMRGGKLCYMHEQIQQTRPQKLDLGPIEDPDSIQTAIRKLQGAIIEGTLDNKQVGQLAYTIQLAAWNVTRTTDRRERI